MKQVNGDSVADNSKSDITKEELKKSLKNNSVIAIKNLLDKNYIKEFNIDENKIINEQSKYLQKGNYEENVTYNLKINSMYAKDIKEIFKYVLVKASINNKDFNVIVKLDSYSNTYSIFLEDYITKYNYNEKMSAEEMNFNSESVEANSYNSHINTKTSDRYVAEQYFTGYKKSMLNNTKEAYSLLDEEYSKKRFQNYEEFQNYVENNKMKIEYSSIKEYQVINKDGTQEYVVIDTNGRYYLFLENSVENYKVILDTYTLDLPEFLEKYNNSSEQDKVLLNTQKFFDSIKYEDYRYAYSKLDENFKNNYFKTLEAFEKYAKEVFLKQNKIITSNMEKQGEVYTYNLKIAKNNAQGEEEIITKSFVMQLKEGTDFVMSFSIN